MKPRKLKMTTADIKTAVRSRDGERCTRCQITNAEHLARHGVSLHVHRLVPGSRYTIDGCVTLCFACHGPQPRRPRGTRDLAHPGLSGEPTFAFHLPQDLLDALGRYCEAQRLVPDRSEVMRLALREYLEREGFWPPPAEPEQAT